MIDEKKIQEHLDRGLDYLGKEKFAQAVEELSAAQKLGSNNPNVVLAIYGALGYAYKGKGDYDLAIANLTRFVELNPNARAVIDRGKTYALKGDYKRAKADFEIVLQAQPNNVEVKALLDEIRKMG